MHSPQYSHVARLLNLWIKFRAKLISHLFLKILTNNCVTVSCFPEAILLHSVPLPGDPGLCSGTSRPCSVSSELVRFQHTRNFSSLLPHSSIRTRQNSTTSGTQQTDSKLHKYHSNTHTFQSFYPCYMYVFVNTGSIIGKGVSTVKESIKT